MWQNVCLQELSLPYIFEYVDLPGLYLVGMPNYVGMFMFACKYTVYIRITVFSI